MYGDTAVAKLFGLDPRRTLKGLPLASYMERIHIGDRLRIDKAISKCLKDGRPYNVEYRVLNRHGEFIAVMEVGRCYTDGTGKPTFCSGIIYPVDQLQAAT
jgi:PAS domain-containing protein